MLPIISNFLQKNDSIYESESNKEKKNINEKNIFNL